MLGMPRNPGIYSHKLDGGRGPWRVGARIPSWAQLLWSLSPIFVPSPFLLGHRGSLRSPAAWDIPLIESNESYILFPSWRQCECFLSFSCAQFRRKVWMNISVSSNDGVLVIMHRKPGGRGRIGGSSEDRLRLYVHLVLFLSVIEFILLCVQAGGRVKKL